MLTYTILNTGKPLIYRVNTGTKGEAATIEVGKVTIGSTPDVVNVGTKTHAIFDFTLPAGGGGSGVVDEELSLTSENPVQNKVVSSKIYELESSKASVGHTHNKNQIVDFPTSLPASDVSAWAKSPVKPSYTATEISGLANVARTGSYNDLTDKPSMVVDVELSTTSENAVQNKTITSKVNQIETEVENVSSSVELISNKVNSLSSVASSGKYEDLTGTPNLAKVATSGNYNDLSNRIEKASSIKAGESGYVTGDMVFNYSTAMTLSTEEEVQAIIDEATATYSETLLNSQLDRINGETV